MQGWLCCENLDCTVLKDGDGKLERIGDCLLYSNLDNKFYNDTIKILDGYFLEGYIVNKKELMEAVKVDEWRYAYKKLTFEDSFPLELEAAFVDSL